MEKCIYIFIAVLMLERDAECHVFEHDAVPLGFESWPVEKLIELIVTLAPPMTTAPIRRYLL